MPATSRSVWTGLALIGILAALVHGPAGDALARHDGGPFDLVLFVAWAGSGLLLLVVCLAVAGLLLPLLDGRG